MTRVLATPRLGAVLAGFLAAAALLLLSTREGNAERAKQCSNNTSSLCQQIERCEPVGFEANGSCRWIYSISRYYWRA
jgi:hypothetical protein